MAVFAQPGSAQEPPPEETTSETFQVGPFALAPMGQPGDQVNRLGDVVPRPEGDIAVRRVTWRFVDENGVDVSSHMAHLHHMVLLDSGRRDQVCSYPAASRFAATGKELTAAQLPEGYAYHSPAGAPWYGVYHVMNMSDQPMQVAIEYTVEYAPPGDLLDVEPYFLDVSGCWDQSAGEYSVPGDGGPGSVHEKTRTYTMAREGDIVAGGGHLHDGGIDVTLDGPDGEVCRSTAVYDMHHMGHLVGITPCGPMDEQFVPGDRYTLTSRYENDEPIPGAMGVMFTYVHHTDPPPPEPEVGVEIGGLGRDGLTAEVTCTNATEVYVDGYVAQQKGGTPPIDGWGSTVVPCADGTVTLPLRGDGMLTGGDVTVELHAWADDGRLTASDSAVGTLQMNGRLDLTPPPAPSSGLPISIDRQTVATADGQAVTGTVQCDGAGDHWVSVNGTQRVGTHAVPFAGSALVACDGVTAISVPVASSDGRLAGGPASVTVSVYDAVDFDVSSASATVRLRAERPGATSEAPPASPLTLVGAARTDGGVAVTVATVDCPAGSLLYLDATVSAVQGAGGRVPPAEPWTWTQATCDGGDLSLTLPAVDVSGNRVFVDVYASVVTGDDYLSTRTWGELAVTGS
jgi:hypothetical protein